MRSFIVIVAALCLTTAGQVSAQTAPATRPAPSRPAPDPAFSLNRAYHAIGEADAQGVKSKYLDSARTHYRSAIARAGRSDAAGAETEARLASDLTGAALADRPAPVPRDLPAPPSPAPRNASAMQGPPAMMGPPRGGRPGGPPGGMMMHGGPGGPEGFAGGPFGRHRGEGIDAAQLGELLKIENTPEAHGLADAALDAKVSSDRAALAGNFEEAGRKRRLGEHLAQAVRALAETDHPDSVRRPGGPWEGHFERTRAERPSTRIPAAR